MLLKTSMIYKYAEKPNAILTLYVSCKIHNDSK